jgi:hypothetical protein
MPQTALRQMRGIVQVRLLMKGKTAAITGGTSEPCGLRLCFDPRYTGQAEVGLAAQKIVPFFKEA